MEIKLIYISLLISKNEKWSVLTKFQKYQNIIPEWIFESIYVCQLLYHHILVQKRNQKSEIRV